MNFPRFLCPKLRALLVCETRKQEKYIIVRTAALAASVQKVMRARLVTKAAAAQVAVRRTVQAARVALVRVVAAWGVELVSRA